MDHFEMSKSATLRRTNFRLEDLAGTRIPGVRMYIKHGILGDVRRSNMWLGLSLIFLLITVYNVSYYVDQYLHQRIRIDKSYLFPSYLIFPKIILCTPTSFSFSRLLNHRTLLQDILATTDNTRDLYEDMLVHRDRNTTPIQLFELMKLELDQIVINCTFQKKNCEPVSITSEDHAQHACFSLDDVGTFHTNTTGRDGGFEILLSLQSYDGVLERPELPGGLKIIFVNTKHMQMPHHHDVVYAKSGHLNSISLIAHRRQSTTNCIPKHIKTDRRAGRMNLNQRSYYENRTVRRCVVQNYYATKTTAILRSQVVYRKLKDQYRESLQTNATTSNQLKSMYVTEVRRRDTMLSRKLLRLTQNLHKSFRSWRVLRCTKSKNRVKPQIFVAYVRGRSEELTSYLTRHLKRFVEGTTRFSNIFIRGAMDLLSLNLGDAFKLTFEKDSMLFTVINAALRTFDEFAAFERVHRSTMKHVIDILGDVDIFGKLNNTVLHSAAPEYSDAHTNLRNQSELLMNCFLKSERIIRNVSFVHTGPLLCNDWNFTNWVKHPCPVEFVCPDFDQAYLDKYKIRYSYMMDASPPPKQNIQPSIFIYCFLGVLTKDAIRAFSIDVKDVYYPDFDLFSLNEIAKAEWPNSSVLELHDLECRSFQACWRLTTSIEYNLYLKFGGTGYRSGGAQLMKFLGVTILGGHDLCKRQSERTRKAFQTYLQIYEDNIIIPFEKMFNRLIRLRAVLPAIRRYRPPYFVYKQRVTPLLKQFENHLIFHLDTGNLSSVANFINRRGKIMIGQMQLNAEYLKSFISRNWLTFADIYRQSRTFDSSLRYESNNFRRTLKENVTMSVLSRNLTKAKTIVATSKGCAFAVLEQLKFQGSHTLRHLDLWLSAIAPVQVRAKQYRSDETLDKQFVGKNFVQLEIYFEDMSEGIDTEELPISFKLLVSRIGGVCRCYMGLKIFNVAEFMGPIFIFLLYRIYLLFS